MNLISCDNGSCGVVLDASKLNFPPEEWNPDKRDESKYVWCSERRETVPKLPCPVCGSDILRP